MLVSLRDLSAGDWFLTVPGHPFMFPHNGHTVPAGLLMQLIRKGYYFRVWFYMSVGGRLRTSVCRSVYGQQETVRWVEPCKVCWVLLENGEPRRPGCVCLC